MIRSRRQFLHSLGVGVAAGVAVDWPLGAVAASAGEPVRAGQSAGPILLDSNENAYGPSPKVAAAIRSATDSVNRYAFRKDAEVTERIAASHGVKPEQVLFGCGSTELVRAAACVYLGRGRHLIQASPTYEAPEDYARSLGAEVVSLPLDQRQAHDLHAMLDRASAATGLIYICNPNNPTATITPRKEIETFIGKLPSTSKVLIDEAYHHYVTPSGMYASFIDRPLADERVIVTRTFSKVYGLAGLRLGYAVAPAATIESMRKFMTQNSLNAIVAQVVGTAIDDTDSIKKFIKRNADDRQEFFNQAMARMLMPIDSHANFVMTNTQHHANEVIEHFRKHNVLIGRHFPPMDMYIRVSLGTPEEMRTFWRTWDMLPWSKKFTHH